MKRIVIATVYLVLLFCAAWAFWPANGYAPIAVAQAPANIRTISLLVNDMVYDPYSKLIYASVPSSVGMNGNSIAIIDPVTANVGPYIFIGSEPNRLAISDDGKYLYVGLDGVAGIRRLNLATRVPEASFPLGSDPFFGLYYPEDIEVRPGNPDEIAVSLRRPGVSPRHGGVALYVNGVVRPDKTQDHTGSNVIEFCSSTAWLYGYNNETTEFGFRRISVSDTGLRQVDVVQNFFGGFGSDFRCSGGLGYTSNGRAFDPAAKALVGSFNLSTGSGFVSAIVRPDASVNRVFYLLASSSGSASTAQIRAFDMRTFLLAGSVDVPNVSGGAGSLIRWGADGLAFRTSASSGQSGGGQIFLVKSDVISGVGPGAVTASAASFIPGRAAPDSIAAVFGTNFSATTVSATTTPLPTTLGGVTVKVKDSVGTERDAPLFFVSPTQINYQVPSGTAPGAATITIAGQSGMPVTGSLSVNPVVPGLFSANASGDGPAAAVAIRVKPDNSQIIEAVIRFDQAQNKFVTTPIDLGPETDRLFLVLFGTGIRQRTDPAKIIARIGRADAQALFAGAQGSLVGVDQVNLAVPRILAGSGEVDVALTMDGQTTNLVKVNFR